MNMKRSILLPLLLAFSGAALAQPAELSTPIRGITLESTDNLDMTLKLIKSSRKRLTVRLVMDDDDISAYKKVVDALAPHANVMVQILDSEQMPNYSVEKIRRRTTRAMNAFGDKVALWEIGNELNGNWVGSSPQEINAKAQAAYEVVKKRNGKTALTLNYWSSPNCYEKDWEATSNYAESLFMKLSVPLPNTQAAMIWQEHSTTSKASSVRLPSSASVKSVRRTKAMNKNRLLWKRKNVSPITITACNNRCMPKWETVMSAAISGGISTAMPPSPK